LRRAGLEEAVLSKAIPMKGRMLHSKDGVKTEFLYDPNNNQVNTYYNHKFHLTSQITMNSLAFPFDSVFTRSAEAI